MTRHPRKSFSLDAGLLLGWGRPAARPFGFANRTDAARTSVQPVLYTGDNHGIAFGPTGSGKTRSYLMTQLLTYSGPVCVLDVKGEAYHVTARRRREMGQAVFTLDPFHLVREQSDRLNPLDIFQLPGSTPEDDAEMLAANLGVGHEFASDNYWTDTASGLIAGLLAHIATTSPLEERNLNTLRRYLFHDDFDYQLAVWLDANTVVSPLARDEFVAYLAAFGQDQAVHPLHGLHLRQVAGQQGRVRDAGRLQLRSASRADRSALDRVPGHSSREIDLPCAPATSVGEHAADGHLPSPSYPYSTDPFSPR